MKGALAHLARATDWQSVGDRFESDMLHCLTYIKHLGNIHCWIFPFVILCLLNQIFHPYAMREDTYKVQQCLNSADYNGE